MLVCVCLQVLDRLLLAQLLGGLQGLQLPAGVVARGPAFCEVTGFEAGTAVAAAGEAHPLTCVEGAWIR